MCKCFNLFELYSEELSPKERRKTTKRIITMFKCLYPNKNYVNGVSKISSHMDKGKFTDKLILKF